ncbi:MOSC domain-containing protein [Shewanella intestini]|uniref:Molybdenum cofactor biosysynthesis protein n=1 Tax=Shewanella intestini TaxID=2017544 RepID=A0ABS5I4A3_9GAMM|nr:MULTISPECIES: MOSC domain-containing protein [Shewanella]MBR9728852.1 molybdenum cofactor biosysynthesis protein [Shewanella intestini]MRG37082.1 molybdenum cofactor biosysynthesis protein [Shewanella sp. XMDDZSB0408]
MPTLAAIAFKDKKRGIMKPLQSANVTTESGVENDIFGRPGKRQVTIMSQQQWQQACDELNQQLDWLTRRVNLLIDGYTFCATDVGKRIYLGESTILEITGETDPCSKMEKSVTGLEAALTLDWRGGITAKVIASGHITIADTVVIK